MLPSDDFLRLADRLIQRQERLFVVEAGGGGALQAALTEAPGASRWFLGGFTCYSDSLKMDWLDLSADLIESHGAVSAACVQALAEAARLRSGADWVLAESGIYGPGGSRPGKPVGLVYMHVAGPAGRAWSESWQGIGDRQAVRRQLAEHSAAMLLRCLDDISSDKI